MNDWFYWAILSAFFAALTAIFAKTGLQGVDPDYATLLRTVVIIVVLTGFVFTADKWSNPLSLGRKSLICLGLSGLATGASWVCYFRALKMGEVSSVAAVDKLSVVFVAILAYLVLQERPAGKEWLGLLLVFTGAIILAIKK